MQARDEILAELDRYERALHARDVEAVMNTFASGAVSYDLAPPLETRADAEKDRAALQAWFASWDGPIESEGGEVTVVVDGDLACAWSLRRMRGTKKDGERVDLWYRNTLCFRRDDARWRVVHAHSSVPMRMDGSGEAAADLVP